MPLTKGINIEEGIARRLCEYPFAF